MKNYLIIIVFLLILSAFFSACGVSSSATPQGGNTSLTVLAAESFLADIAQNVVGDRRVVGALLPLGLTRMLSLTLKMSPKSLTATC
jgi:ABC-type Zn uptake system ZnuABC Zn-binding protein ZnuA